VSERDTTLLVIDVQREYMEPEPFVTRDGNDLIAKCRTLLDSARAAGAPVVFVRHLDRQPPADPAKADICPELAPRCGEPIIEKRFASAFMKTDLDETLARLSAKRLVVCGLATFGCLNATVLCALCKGYDVAVVRDAHGARPLSDATVDQVFDHFEAAWVDTGAQLVPAAEVRFTT